jgi:hypothetical protein
MQEFNFDKFMKDIEKRTEKNKARKKQQKRDEDESLGKKWRRRYQELPGNKIRYDK